MLYFERHYRLSHFNVLAMKRSVLEPLVSVGQLNSSNEQDIRERKWRYFFSLNYSGQSNNWKVPRRYVLSQSQQWRQKKVHLGCSLFFSFLFFFFQTLSMYLPIGCYYRSICYKKKYDVILCQNTPKHFHFSLNVHFLRY